MAKNYLNNKDMLLEIHKSKMSYCNKDVDEEYFMYDLILDHVDEIDNDKIHNHNLQSMEVNMEPDENDNEDSQKQDSDEDGE